MRTHPSRSRLTILSILFLLVSHTCLDAKVRTLDLPDDYDVFAMHPDTGTIAALSSESGEVVFFRGVDLARNVVVPASRVRVGSSPVSVCYRRFQNLEVFAVACLKDRYLYLINAGGKHSREKEFTLLKKVELQSVEAMGVTGSSNPEDPFLYYCSGVGINAIDLRALQDRGPVVESVSSCTPSANGDTMYALGGGPTGFQSFILTNHLDDKKPEFSQRYYNHDTSYTYFPGPFNNYVANNSKVYSRTLEESLADFDFAPQCFFRKYPVIVGISDGEFVPWRRGRPIVRSGQPRSKPEIKLHAASYNSLQAFGTPVSIQQGSLSREYPFVVPRLSRKQFRVFADDARRQVVFARRKQIHFIPLEDFQIPDEPLLLASLEGSQEFKVQQEDRLKLKSADPKVKVEVVAHPDAAKIVGNELTWTPQPDQIGRHELSVKLTWEKLERTFRFPLTVSFPSLQLPIVPAGFDIDLSAGTVVLWEAPKLDRYGRLIPPAPGDGYELLELDLATGKTIATRTTNEPVVDVAYDGQYLIAAHGGPTQQCEIFDREKPNLKQTVTATQPILAIFIYDGNLMVQTNSNVEVFKLGRFERVAQVRSYYNTKSKAVTPYGIYSDLGILTGYDLKPKLLVMPSGLPYAVKLKAFQLPEFLERESSSQITSTRLIHPSKYGTEQLLSTTRIPGSGGTVSLGLVLNQSTVSNHSRTLNRQRDVYLTFSGPEVKKIRIVRDQQYVTQIPANEPIPQLKLTPGHAFVLYGRDLYRFDRTDVEGHSEPGTKPLEWVPRQSSFVLDQGQNTELEHEVQGGSAPYQFRLIEPLRGTSIDTATGKITLENDTIRDQVLEPLADFFLGGTSKRPTAQKVDRQAESLKRFAGEQIGVPVSDIPILLPIRIEVSDANKRSTTIQYFVIVDVAKTKLERQLRKTNQTERN